MVNQNNLNNRVNFGEEIPLLYRVKGKWFTEENLEQIIYLVINNIPDGDKIIGELEIELGIHSTVITKGVEI